MPPIRKFLKEDIVTAAYNLVRKEGFESVNARRIAKELGGSVQLIYHNFSTMEELNEEVEKRVYEKYREYMENGIDSKKPYLAKGIAYVKFARDYPEFFKVVFMSKREVSTEELFKSDEATIEGILNTIDVTFPSTLAERLEFHKKMWIFTHGIACLIATKTVNFTDREVEELLTYTAVDMYKGYNIRRNV